MGKLEDRYAYDTRPRPDAPLPWYARLAPYAFFGGLVLLGLVVGALTR